MFIILYFIFSFQLKITEGTGTYEESGAKEQESSRQGVYSNVCFK